MTEYTATNSTLPTASRRRRKQLSLVKPAAQQSPVLDNDDEDDWGDDPNALDYRVSTFIGNARAALRDNQPLPTLERRLLTEMREFTAAYTDAQIVDFFNRELTKARAAYRLAVTRARVLARQLGIDLEAPNAPSAEVKRLANAVLNPPEPSTTEVERLLQAHLFAEHQEYRSLAFLETYATQHPELLR